LVEVKTYYGFFIKIPKGERIGEELYDDDGVVVLVPIWFNVWGTNQSYKKEFKATLFFIYENCNISLQW